MLCPGSWQFYGSCFISPEQVRLTRDDRSLKGAIYNTVPVTFPEWEVHITFRVHGATGKLFGDGFAFWYTRDFLSPGDAFGSQAKFYGLGVFFDTYSNHNGEHKHDHPYISAMVDDGTSLYDHNRDGTHTQLAGCSSNFRNLPQDAVAAIRYSRKQLRVSVDLDNSGKWRDCFTAYNVNLPTNLYFGLSAATGDLSDNHDIRSMKVYELEGEQDTVDHSKIVPYAGGLEKALGES
ncbi:unnamed protein product [Protopolystoma xenopodis]|uniref:L-type lectin-like domain-containing protein n=1 Tax=Protopolystoma xenopodis TaxID=117903 RepID=A0A3S5ABE8_9PLAT|nr:unnamed protein product [Protopolystoma xenopodis]